MKKQNVEKIIKNMLNDKNSTFRIVDKNNQYWVTNKSDIIMFDDFIKFVVNGTYLGHSCNVKKFMEYDDILFIDERLVRDGGITA